MNDLDLIRDFVPEAPLLSGTELSGARHRVLTQISRGRATSARGVRPRRAELRPGLARRMAIGGVTVAAAAAITAGVLMVAGTAPAGVTVPAQLTAREVLDQAATAALRETTVVPREDQFVYTKEVSPGGVVQLSWLSVDGTRDGLTESPMNGKMEKSVQQGCVNGARTMTVPCTPERAFFPDMPTTVAAMGPYLERTQGIRPSDLNDLSKTIGFMLRDDYILPAQRAALYKYLATTPGLTVQRQVRDVSGRLGIGVVWSYQGGKSMNIFDPRTFAYLGVSDFGEQGQEGGDALVQTAIVNRAGEFPERHGRIGSLAVAGASCGNESRWRVSAWLAWPAGLIAAGIGLYLCYLHVSRTLAVSSDGASNALQAWAMLHGNPLLRGWTVSDVSFYTTELPEYVLVEMVRRLNPDVLHVSAAITYTLVVLAAGLLARGGAPGREGVLRMTAAAGIMVAPQLGPGVYILVFQPDHIGTQVPLLLTWLVLDAGGRRTMGRVRWWVPVLVCALLAWVEVADRLAVLIGAVPLAAVSGVRAYQVLVQRREGLRAGWLDLSLLLAAGVSTEISSLAVRQIGEHGGYTVLPVADALSPVSAMSSHWWLAVESVSGLYGAHLFGMSSPGLDAAFAFVHLTGLALAAWAVWLAIRRFFRCADRIAQVLALGIVVNVAAYLLSTVPLTYWSAREMAGVLPAGAVLAGRMLSGRLLKASMVPALTVVLACYLAALAHTVVQPSRPASTQDLADWLVVHHLTYGLSSYGIANTTTLASGGAVSVRPVSFYGSDVTPGPDEFDQAWYDPAAHDATFVVLLNRPAAHNETATGELRGAFGRPARTYTFGRYVIMAYDTNLLTDLSPSRPPR
jgi:hypothetical protein